MTTQQTQQTHHAWEATRDTMDEHVMSDKHVSVCASTQHMMCHLSAFIGVLKHSSQTKHCAW